MGKLRLREGRREQRGWGRAREGGRRKGKQGVGEERGGLLKVTAIQKPRKLQKEWYVGDRNSKKGEEMLVRPQASQLFLDRKPKMQSVFLAPQRPACLPTSYHWPC